MWRIILEPLAFFLAPFLVYFLFLLLFRRLPLARASWSASALSLLALTGLLSAVCGMIFFGLTASRETGAYTPAHVENGRVTPGQFKGQVK